MKQTTELFKKHMKCDMCSWEGTTAAAGPHVISTHLKEIDKRIMSIIAENGTTVEDVMAATGFPADRVRGRFRTLAKRGKINLVRDNFHYVAYPLKKKKAKAKPSVSTTSPKHDAPTADGLVFDSLMSQINRKADEMLKEKYKDEYDGLVSARVEAIFTNLTQFKGK